jgi:hypothetical protein
MQPVTQLHFTETRSIGCPTLCSKGRPVLERNGLTGANLNLHTADNATDIQEPSLTSAARPDKEHLVFASRYFRCVARITEANFNFYSESFRHAF